MAFDQRRQDIVIYVTREGRHSDSNSFLGVCASRKIQILRNRTSSCLLMKTIVNLDGDDDYCVHTRRKHIDTTERAPV